MTVRKLIKKKNNFDLIRKKAIDIFENMSDYNKSIQYKFFEKQYTIFKFQTDRTLKHM